MMIFILSLLSDFWLTRWVIFVLYVYTVEGMVIHAHFSILYFFIKKLAIDVIHLNRILCLYFIKTIKLLEY